MTDHLSDATWFKSSWSGGDRNCVEVAFLADGTVGIRDSKDPTGAPLVVDPAMWDAFTATIAGGSAPR